jgi:hypothetical protein
VTVEISIDHPAATTLLNAVRGVVLASRYLIEPCGNGKSKVMHLARVDTKYVIFGHEFKRNHIFTSVLCFFIIFLGDELSSGTRISDFFVLLTLHVSEMD